MVTIGFGEAIDRLFSKRANRTLVLTDGIGNHHLPLDLMLLLDLLHEFSPSRILRNFLGGLILRENAKEERSQRRFVTLQMNPISVEVLLPVGGMAQKITLILAFGELHEGLESSGHHCLLTFARVFDAQVAPEFETIEFFVASVLIQLVTKEPNGESLDFGSDFPGVELVHCSTLQVGHCDRSRGLDATIDERPISLSSCRHMVEHPDFPRQEVHNVPIELIALGCLDRDGISDISMDRSSNSMLRWVTIIWSTM